MSGFVTSSSGDASTIADSHHSSVNTATAELALTQSFESSAAAGSISDHKSASSSSTYSSAPLPTAISDLPRTNRAFSTPDIRVYLQEHAQHPVRSQSLALTWLGSGGTEEAKWRYRDVWNAVQSIAEQCQRWQIPVGSRVIFLFPFSFDSVLTLLGCICAGITAVLVYPPNPHRMAADLERLRLLIEDAQPHAIITNRDFMQIIRISKLAGHASRWAKLGCPIHTVEIVTPAKTVSETVLSSAAAPLSVVPTRVLVPRSPNDTAFLQYTSGSTSFPKGVVVSMWNVAHNLENTRINTRITEHERAVTWLPNFHDFGLITNYLNALCAGAHLIAMSPLTFLGKPTGWFDAIEKYKGNVTCSPNFGYALVCKRVAEQRAQEEAIAKKKGRSYTPRQWDLSSLRCLNLSAEIINPSTLQQLQSLIGVRFDQIDQSYGMAEAVAGIVDGGRGVDADTNLAACGDLHRCRNWGVELRIGKERKTATAVEGDLQEAQEEKKSNDPPSVSSNGSKCKPMVWVDPVPEGEVGAVYLRGPTMVRSYWNRPELARNFACAFVDEDLRAVEAELDQWTNPMWYTSGDLGYFKNGMLYLCGRSKEIIIINGRNIYPNDLERAVEGDARLTAAIRPGQLVAFARASDKKGTEEVVMALELQPYPYGGGEAGFPTSYLEAIAKSVRRIVSTTCGVGVSSVLLLEARSLLKTTSGKMQRTKMSQQYQLGNVRGLIKEIEADAADDGAELNEAMGGLQAVDSVAACVTSILSFCAESAVASDGATIDPTNTILSSVLVESLRITAMINSLRLTTNRAMPHWSQLCDLTIQQAAELIMQQETLDTDTDRKQQQQARNARLTLLTPLLQLRVAEGTRTLLRRVRDAVSAARSASGWSALIGRIPIHASMVSTSAGGLSLTFDQMRQLIHCMHVAQPPHSSLASLAIVSNSWAASTFQQQIPSLLKQLYASMVLTAQSTLAISAPIDVIAEQDWNARFSNVSSVASQGPEAGSLVVSSRSNLSPLFTERSGLLVVVARFDSASVESNSPPEWKCVLLERRWRGVEVTTETETTATIKLSNVYVPASHVMPISYAQQSLLTAHLLHCSAMVAHLDEICASFLTLQRTESGNATHPILIKSDSESVTMPSLSHSPSSLLDTAAWYRRCSQMLDAALTQVCLMLDNADPVDRDIVLAVHLFAARLSRQASEQLILLSREPIFGDESASKKRAAVLKDAQQRQQDSAQYKQTGIVADSASIARILAASFLRSTLPKPADSLDAEHRSQQVHPAESEELPPQPFAQLSNYLTQLGLNMPNGITQLPLTMTFVNWSIASLSELVSWIVVAALVAPTRPTSPASSTTIASPLPDESHNSPSQLPESSEHHDSDSSSDVLPADGLASPTLQSSPSMSQTRSAKRVGAFVQALQSGINRVVLEAQQPNFSQSTAVPSAMGNVSYSVASPSSLEPQIELQSLPPHAVRFHIHSDEDVAVRFEEEGSNVGASSPTLSVAIDKAVDGSQHESIVPLPDASTFEAVDPVAEQRMTPSWVKIAGNAVGIWLLLTLFSVCAIPAWHLYGDWMKKLGSPGLYIDAINNTKITGLLPPLLVLLYHVTLTVALILLRWVLVWPGEAVPGFVAPLNSSFAFRWWMLQRCVTLWEFATGWLLVDTPLLNVVYIALGGKIAMSARLGNFLRFPPMVEIEAGAQLDGSIVTQEVRPDGCIHFAQERIALRANSNLRHAAVLYMVGDVAEESVVDYSSLVEESSIEILPRAFYSGNPIEFKHFLPVKDSNDSGRTRRMVVGFLQLFLGLPMSMLLVLCVFRWPFSFFLSTSDAVSWGRYDAVFRFMIHIGLSVSLLTVGVVVFTWLHHLVEWVITAGATSAHERNLRYQRSMTISILRWICSFYYRVAYRLLLQFVDRGIVLVYLFKLFGAQIDSTTVIFSLMPGYLHPCDARQFRVDSGLGKKRSAAGLFRVDVEDRSKIIHICEGTGAALRAHFILRDQQPDLVRADTLMQITAMNETMDPKHGSLRSINETMDPKHGSFRSMALGMPRLATAGTTPSLYADVPISPRSNPSPGFTPTHRREGSKALASNGRRVAVIGGGISGILTAHYLQELGYRVTVFERSHQVGGLCASVKVDGRYHDSGAIIMGAHYELVPELVQQVGAELDDPILIQLADTANDPAARAQAERHYKTKFEEMLRLRSLFQPYFADIEAPGFDQLPADSPLALPLSEFLKDFAGPEGCPFNLSLYVVCGYGAVAAPGHALDVPAYYFAKFLLFSCPLMTDNVPSYYRCTLKNGAAQFLQKLAEVKQIDVKTSTEVAKVERNESGVRICTRDAARGLINAPQEFDEMVIAVPPKAAMQFLDSTPEEQKLMSQVKYLPYLSIVVKLAPIDPSQPYAFDHRNIAIMLQASITKAHTNCVLSVTRLHEDSDAVVVYAFDFRAATSAGRVLTVEERNQIALEDITAELARDYNAKVREVFRFQRNECYMPHVSSEAIKGGFFDQITALQGQRRCFWVGGLFAMETLETNAQFARYVARQVLHPASLQRRFGVDLTQFAPYVTADGTAWPETPFAKSGRTTTAAPAGHQRSRSSMMKDFRFGMNSQKKISQSSTTTTTVAPPPANWTTLTIPADTMLGPLTLIDTPMTTEPGALVQGFPYRQIRGNIATGSAGAKAKNVGGGDTDEESASVGHQYFLLAGSVLLRFMMVLSFLALVIPCSEVHWSLMSYAPDASSPRETYVFLVVWPIVLLTGMGYIVVWYWLMNRCLVPELGQRRSINSSLESFLFLRYALYNLANGLMSPYISLLEGTVFRTRMLRFLGATIASSAHIEDAIMKEEQLLRIGRCAVANPVASITGHMLVRRRLVMEEVEIGDGAHLSSHSWVQPPSYVPPSTHLLPNCSFEAQPNYSHHVLSMKMGGAPPRLFTR